MRRYLGIDPGLTGAWVLLEADGTLVASDLVPQRAGKNGKPSVDLATLARVLREMKGVTSAALEAVGARPGEGGTSMFTFGRTVGAWEGLIAANDWVRIDVLPTSWSRLVSAVPIRVQPTDDSKEAKKKAAAQARALRKAAAASAAASRWPTLPLARKKDWPRADAAWIAEWARQEDVRVGRIAV